jgi:methylenetetrahydrofolate reductase (NADPH)
MLIKNKFNQKNTVVSFEIFPPKKDSPIHTIYKTIEELADLSPDFISVTYGAGGASHNHTIKIASLVQNKYNIDALAHLTCLTATKDEIKATVDELKDQNVHNILALRGDFPENKDVDFPNPLHFTYASDLLKHIKENNPDFCMGAACYPEGHLECKSYQQDLLNLQTKVKSGSDFLISQMFFDNQYFYNFLTNLHCLSLDIPVMAGIMPVVNKKQIEKIVSLCGASIPVKFRKILDRYGDQPEALQAAGISYATDQIIDLLSSGVRGIHLYTMNRPEIAKEIMRNIAPILKSIEAR